MFKNIQALCAVLSLCTAIALHPSLAFGFGSKPVNPPPPPPVVTSCQITLAACPSNPSLFGTFTDNASNAGSNQAECMQRATDYYSSCGMPLSSNLSTTATYFSSGKAIQKNTVENGASNYWNNPGTLPRSNTITGTIYYATDTTVSGCAFDKANPNAALPVQVFTPDGMSPTFGLAAYGCPWNPTLNGHGFQIQYRHPLNSTAGVNVVVLAADQKSTATFNSSMAQHQLNFFNRATQTFLYNTPNYQVGFSTKYGAAVSEFYNNRVDPTLNLITSDPGAMVQTAFFGNTDAFSGTSCFGNIAGFNLYNPTQAGSDCPDSAGTPLGSTADLCTSSNNNALCHQININNPAPNDASPDWIQYRVHYRNFFYPTGTTAYQPYDDVYGYVKYTFKANFVQIDFQNWKTTAASFGPNFDQVPIAFYHQVNSFKTDVGSIARSAGDGKEVGRDMAYTFNSGNQRWILAESLALDPALPVITPGDFVTTAFYSSIIDGAGSNCPVRKYQGDMFGAASATDNTWMSIENSSVFQNAFASNVLQMGVYYTSRAVFSPFYPSSIVSGMPVSTLVDTLESRGGTMPSWECNQ